MKKQNAFTLAEVLITLGIIGVVAAMTMPTLLNSTQNKQYITAYKRALSELSQAGTINYAQEFTDFSNGEIPEILKKQIRVSKFELAGTSQKLYFNDGIAVQVKNASGCVNQNLSSNETGGTLMTLNPNCVALIDVNGKKGPTTTMNLDINTPPTGKDQFLVLFTEKNVIPFDTKGRKIMNSDSYSDNDSKNNQRLANPPEPESD